MQYLITQLLKEDSIFNIPVYYQHLQKKLVYVQEKLNFYNNINNTIGKIPETIINL